MTRIAYTPKKFNASSQALIATADAIMREYADQGFALTLRQLYYQFVARGVIPNTLQSYKRLGSIINDARLAGLLDWNNIEDRTRSLSGLPKWDDPADVISSAAEGYKIDLWDGQPVRPEIWIEKEALSGVIEPTAFAYRVDYFACRGYTSQSEQWRAAMRIVRRWRNEQQRTIIFHLGDHDPSGIDMTRDNTARLELFCAKHVGIIPFELRRLALNMDQVEEHSPPPNPTKLTDSRAEGYLEAFGDESWELDALNPTLIAELLTENVDQVLEDGDRDRYDARKAQEAEERELLRSAAARWEDVADFLKEDE